MELQELADHARGFFQQKERPGTGPHAEPTHFWTLKETYPAWIREMLYGVHENGNFLPDDYKYEYTVRALDWLSEGNDPDGPELETDVYNSQLLEWLASHLERPGYVDEMVADTGHSDSGIIGDIGLGQLREREDVYWRVLEALRERLGAIERDEPETMERGGKEVGPKEWSPRWGR